MFAKLTKIALVAAVTVGSLSAATIGSAVLSTSAEAAVSHSRYIHRFTVFDIYRRHMMAKALNPQPLPPGPPPCKCDIGSINMGSPINAR